MPAKKKSIKNAQKKSSNPPVSPPVSDADKALFRDTVGAVKRLHNDRADTRPTPPKPIPKKHTLTEQQWLATELEYPVDSDDGYDGDDLHYRANGVKPSVVRQLRREHYPNYAVLDLHGMTVQAARHAFAMFLLQAKLNKQSCIRIIHGKGKSSQNRTPILKGKLGGWLRQRDDVLAFCPAKPADGGTGAVCVLLRL